MPLANLRTLAHRGFALVATLTLLTLGITPSVAANQQSRRERAFQAAAAEFEVPEEILKAVSYNQSRWENHDGKPSVSGGYGLMHLTDEVEPQDGRGDPKRPIKARKLPNQTYTLDKAAQLLGISAEELKKSDTQNIRGGAAVLAEFAKKSNEGQLPMGLEEWSTAIAHYAQANTQEAAKDFADNVYETIKKGVQHTTTDGHSLSINPKYVGPELPDVKSLNLPSQPAHPESDTETDCPPTITCKWAPARFAQNDPNNIYDFGNYDYANREEDMDIKYIVIHDTEGSYESAINWYQDPRSYVSAHYTIRSSDGEVTQSVKNKDVAWHAANWYVNTHSIGIEHEGFAAEGATWYTEAMYRSSAKLVRYLAHKYDIPLDREHIVGHDQYHAPTAGRVAGMHWDPGPYWDWGHYMNLLHRPTVPTAGWHAKAVTIAPKFNRNKPEIIQCNDGTCTPLPEQGANFVYLHTEPNEDAPLLTDAGLYPEGVPGTKEIEDWSAKAIHGQRFAVADRQGEWTAVWFGGQKGWFKNPRFWNRTALPARAKRVTPKEGMDSIPVYGRPWPEESAYPPSEAPFQGVNPLQYEIPTGQAYVAYERETVNDYYHVWTFDRSGPGDGDIIVGDEKYIPISYNHRQAYVKASDVEFVH